MVQEEIKPILFLAETHEHGAQQRPPLHVVRQSGLLTRQTQRLWFTLIGRELAQIQGFDVRLKRRLHDLHWPSVDRLEGGMPGFMAADNFAQAALQRRQVQRSPTVHRYRFVVEILGKLAVQPNLFLGKGERRRPRLATRYCGRIRNFAGHA